MGNIEVMRRKFIALGMEHGNNIRMRTVGFGFSVDKEAVDRLFEKVYTLETGYTLYRSKGTETDYLTLGEDGQAKVHLRDSTGYYTAQITQGSVAYMYKLGKTIDVGSSNVFVKQVMEIQTKLKGCRTDPAEFLTNMLNSKDIQADSSNGKDYIGTTKEGTKVRLRLELKGDSIALEVSQGNHVKCDLFTCNYSGLQRFKARVQAKSYTKDVPVSKYGSMNGLTDNEVAKRLVKEITTHDSSVSFTDSFCEELRSLLDYNDRLGNTASVNSFTFRGATITVYAIEGIAKYRKVKVKKGNIDEVMLFENNRVGVQQANIYILNRFPML